MLLIAIAGGVICAASLTAGLVARTAIARSPVRRAGQACITAPQRWRPLAHGLIARDKPLALLAIWLMFLDTVIALAAPWPLMIVVDYGLGHYRHPPSLGPLGTLSPLWLAAAAAAVGLLLVMLGSVAGYLVTFLLGALGERMTVRLRTALVAHVLRAEPGAVTRYPLGELTSRIGTDATAVVDAVAATVDTLIPDAAVLAGMTVITALLDWRLTLVVLGVIPLYAITARLRNTALRPAQRDARARSGELATLATGLLARIPLIHVFHRANTEVQRYQQASGQAASAAVTALDASARFAPVADTLPGLGLAAALVTGTIEVSSGRLTLGGLLVFLAYLSSLTTPVRSLARLSTVIARGTASRDRVAELLRLPVLQPADLTPRPGQAGSHHRARLPSPAAHPGPVPARRDRWLPGPAIRLDRVTFAYRSRRPVLAAANLHVAPGTVVCVTGPSGSGKSTLLSLLVRLAEPQSGRIEVDGRDISGIPLSALRELVTLVPQDPWLHAGTIAENIGYGRAGATGAQVAAAAEHAGVAAFARDLPLGLQTPVGEDGTQLSGGQQRRVAVARALLAETPVLLLDEPTTGLDPVTESRLIDDLLAVTRGKTLVMVTHQPRLTERADHVVRVDGGRIMLADTPPATLRPVAVPA
jgi:ABC-type multidrug transport system fused ATPase/permease subunit